MTDDERKAALDRLRSFVKQQRQATTTADQGSLERAAEVVALYEDGAWVAEMDEHHPIKLKLRGRQADPESFSRFTRWLTEKADLRSSAAYRLRDAHTILSKLGKNATATGAASVLPLKWMDKHDYGGHESEVWTEAVRLAAGGAPTEEHVRKALSGWKKENVPKAERTGTRTRGGKAAVERLLRDAERLMDEYPELFADAMERIEAEARARMAEEAMVA